MFNYFKKLQPNYLRPIKQSRQHLTRLIAIIINCLKNKHNISVTWSSSIKYFLCTKENLGSKDVLIYEIIK